VVDDVPNLARVQFNVDAMKHVTHARKGVVELHVPRSVVHEGTDPVSELDAALPERGGDAVHVLLVLPVRDLVVAVRGLGDHHVVGLHLRAAFEYVLQ